MKADWEASEEPSTTVSQAARAGDNEAERAAAIASRVADPRDEIDGGIKFDDFFMAGRAEKPGKVLKRGI